MFYDFSFTVPAGTTAALPHVEHVKLTHGIIHRVEVGFPDGCKGTVHVAIRHGLHQAFPTNPQGTFHSDSYNIAFNDHYPLTSKPYRLSLYGWSPGTTYPHDITIRIGLLPAKIILPEETFIVAFNKLLARLRL